MRRTESIQGKRATPARGSKWLRAPQIIRLFIAGKPIGKERARVVNRHAYTPKRTADWERLVHYEAIRQLRKLDRTWKPWDGEVVLTLRFSGGNRADVDNLAKAVMDGLEGTLYKNDRQVRHLYAWRENGKPLGVVIEAEEIADAKLDQA